MDKILKFSNHSFNTCCISRDSLFYNFDKIFYNGDFSRTINPSYPFYKNMSDHLSLVCFLNKKRDL